MNINEIIKEKRKALGMTQEQIADLLGVSAPAVNKWEKGATYPDIMLLPALARLLKTDLNTLMSFREDLSEQEIGSFLNELNELCTKKGYDSAFRKAMEKIREYPSCEKLICNTALFLEGALTLYSYSIDGREEYENQIEALYERLADSENQAVRDQATAMLIKEHLERKEYEKAEALIERLPDRTVDKDAYYISLYTRQGLFDKASRHLTGKLIRSLTGLQSALLGMLEVAVQERRHDDARFYAVTYEKVTKEFDFMGFTAYTALLELYIKEKDREGCLSVLRSMLPAMGKKLTLSDSPFYRYVAKDKAASDAESLGSQMLTSVLSELENSPEFDFMRDSEEFDELLRDLRNG